MINLSDVTVIKNKIDILKNVDWEVKKGEHWSILGLNGSGKTTLLNVINGYLHPTYGHVEVLGELFGKTYIPDLRKQIGLISASIQQQIKDFESVLSIVLSGKFASIGLWDAVEKTDIEQAQSYIGLLNCEHLQDREYGTLSQGERQRVLIARALMAHPKILILDEPCNGLDIISREELLKIIEELSKSKDCPTLIYVTHHVEEILPCFTHTLLLKNGEVFCQGLSKELLTEITLSNFFERPVAVQIEQNRTWIALKESLIQN
ncbi:ABC transporter ATP-binding protein [Lysinibacillus sp. SGAir0095]|uniref:ABC transporter ATP-binding protein n=1 Tax=Lysinibacillus sp. SGAir0095 TaxID=2070463 RepID=UPI0010CD0118|nr:ABC transporter ATP-binding protein [Lysinibacillus sp. SGAir0095]QCR32771.1 molybdenum ABC transporter ATP-binding protein [Lysinibacillus sp. SGAir0095]